MPRRDVETKGYLSPEEAGELLGLSRRTIYRRIKDGTVPARRVGGVWRIQRAELDRALAEAPPVAGPRGRRGRRTRA